MIVIVGSGFMRIALIAVIIIKLSFFCGLANSEEKIGYDVLRKISIDTAKSLPIQINKMTMLDSVVATPDLFMVYKYTVIEGGFFQSLSEGSGVAITLLPSVISENFGTVLNAMKIMMEGEAERNKNKACSNKVSTVYRLLLGGVTLVHQYYDQYA